jgi:hypothetical protein
MEFEFDNQEENYPIILLPNKIYKSLTEKIDDSQIEKELGITKPKKHIPAKPQAPSRFKYDKSLKTEFKHTEHSGCIILIFIASIILSFFVADSILDGLKFIFFGTLGLYFTSLLEIIFKINCQWCILSILFTSSILFTANLKQNSHFLQLNLSIGIVFITFVFLSYVINFTEIYFLYNNIYL